MSVFSLQELDALAAQLSDLALGHDNRSKAAASASNADRNVGGAVQAAELEDDDSDEEGQPQGDGTLLASEPARPL